MPAKRSTWVMAAVATLGLWGSGARAQTAAPGTTDQAFETLVDAAGVIFSGTVTAVRRPAPATPGAAAVVEIDFAVADAVRGVTGSTYTLREWAGLWAATDQPFAPGQRFLMLLHTPNAAGLSSPVGGPDGAIPLRAAGATSAGGQTLASAASVAGSGNGSQTAAAPGAVVDLGWIATRVAVPLAYQTSVARTGVGTNTARANVAASAAGGAQAVAASTQSTASAQVAPAASVPSTSGLPATIPASVRSADYGSVLAKLRTWEAARNATR